MVLYVSNPINSLREIDQILDIFQEVSWLHTNKDKSLIYLMQIKDSFKAALSQNFEYAWTCDVWKFLGVSIPIDFSTFSKWNLETVHAMDNQHWKLGMTRICLGLSKSQRLDLSSSPNFNFCSERHRWASLSLCCFPGNTLSWTLYGLSKNLIYHIVF